MIITIPQRGEQEEAAKAFEDRYNDDQVYGVE